MYATQDLKSRMFIQKYDDSEMTREQLDRAIARTALAHPDIIVGGIHIDDATETVDWQSEIVLGPKGSTLIITRTEKAIPIGDTSKKLQSVNREHRAALAKAKADFTVALTKLQDAYESEVMALIRAGKVAGKPSKPMVGTAGYDSKGNWHEAGELLK